MRLPPDRYTLSSQNYRLVEDRAMEVEAPTPPPTSAGEPPSFVDPSEVLGVANKEFVNPQMIMPTKTPAPKWTEDDDYD